PPLIRFARARRRAGKRASLRASPPTWQCSATRGRTSSGPEPADCAERSRRSTPQSWCPDSKRRIPRSDRRTDSRAGCPSLGRTRAALYPGGEYASTAFRLEPARLGVLEADRAPYPPCSPNAATTAAAFSASPARNASSTLFPPSAGDDASNSDNLVHGPSTL